MDTGGAATHPMATSSSEILTIGEIAARYQVTMRALRFYEDRGLLSPRRVDGARFYDGAATRQLEMVLKGKRLGFSLTEIRDLVRRDRGGDATELALEPEQVNAQIELLHRQRTDIERAIDELRATLRDMRGASVDAPDADASGSGERKFA
jgi:DNA-binding transcriptional MerR regulator